MGKKKSISKLYRKILTSNEMKAFLLYEKCDETTKEKLLHKLAANNSEQARDILKKIENL